MVLNFWQKQAWGWAVLHDLAVLRVNKAHKNPQRLRHFTAIKLQAFERAHKGLTGLQGALSSLAV